MKQANEKLYNIFYNKLYNVFHSKYKYIIVKKREF